MEIARHAPICIFTNVQFLKIKTESMFVLPTPLSVFVNSTVKKCKAAIIQGKVLLILTNPSHVFP